MSVHIPTFSKPDPSLNQDLAWDYPDVFSLSLKVHPEDIDGLSHTNNAVYVQWCQLLAWEHSESLGLSIGDYQSLDRAMAIRSSTYDYVMPSHLGDELIVGTWLTKSEKINMERRFQVIRARDGHIIMRGRWDLVCIEISSGRPKRLPREFADIYKPAVVSTQAEQGE